MRLSNLDNALTGSGLVACVFADLNGDGSEDMAFACTDGTLSCVYNDLFDVSGVRVRLDKGNVGPVTVSIWQGTKRAFCTGARTVLGHGFARFLSVRRPGQCTLRWHVPGAPDAEKVVDTRDVTPEFVIR